MENNEHDELLNRIAQQDRETMQSRYEAAVRKAEAVFACMVDDTYTTSGRDKVIAANPIDSVTLMLLFDKAIRLTRSEQARLVAKSKNADMRAFVINFYNANKSRYESKDQFLDDMLGQKLEDEFKGRKIPVRSTVEEWLPKDGGMRKPGKT